jgi:hypothetical protein
MSRYFHTLISGNAGLPGDNSRQIFNIFGDNDFGVIVPGHGALALRLRLPRQDATSGQPLAAES